MVNLSNNQKTVIFLMTLGLLFWVKIVKAEQAQVYPVRYYIFHLSTCPHCKEELKFLEKLKSEYPNLEVRDFEVSKSFQNQSLFDRSMKAYGLQAGGVPVGIVGDKAIVGYDDERHKGSEIEEDIIKCSKEACQSKVDDILGLEKISSTMTIDIGADSKIIKELSRQQGDSDQKTSQPDSINFSFLGKDFCIGKESSVCALGIVLGLADGINPCMFSVLIFLLTYLLAIGSRKRALKAGIAFIITTFLVYFLLMYGIIKIIAVLQIADLARKLVAGIALIAGVLMIKDFFWYGKGISLEIPQRYKPKIEALIKTGTVPSAVALAIFSSLVELPCTSGLPLAYASILSQKNLYPLWYLLVYNVFFILPLVVIVLGVIFAWMKVEKVEGARNNLKPYMRLVAGILLLILAFFLLK